MSSSNKGKAVAREPLDIHPRVVSPIPMDEVEIRPERVKISTGNLVQVKHTLDDAVKEYFGRSYRRSHRHENVRLGLGWTSVLLAFAVSLYGLKVPFKDHKRLLTAVVVTYYVLSGLLAFYIKYVEGNQIFEGRRKVHAGRIETHLLTLRSTLDRKPYDNPKYEVTLQYVHSTNNGKSLLGSRKVYEAIPIRSLFDVDGVLARDALVARLQELEKAPSA